jgi:4-hydroxymandelate oxidase
MLRDIVEIDTGVTLLGTKVNTPVMVAPTGRHHLFHANGERETARGAAAAGAVFVMSTSGSTLVEDVAKERGSVPQWFQLYMQPDRKATAALLERCVKAGFPRAYRIPVVPTDKFRSVNMVGQPVARTAYDIDRKGIAMFPTNFGDLEWLVKHAGLPVVVKGVLRGDDARRCVDCGVKGIMVSNHGGRHLDTTVTTAEVLAEIAQAVGNSAEVYVDGGIRRGTDIIKALALGARAVLLGRPPLWGLSVAGADGVKAVMAHMHDEMVRAMRLCGAASLAALTSDLVAG